MKLRWLPVIAITMLVCNVMLAYRTNFLRDRIVELERQVERLEIQMEMIYHEAASEWDPAQ